MQYHTSSFQWDKPKQLILLMKFIHSTHRFTLLALISIVDRTKCIECMSLIFVHNTVQNDFKRQLKQRTSKKLYYVQLIINYAMSYYINIKFSSKSLIQNKDLNR